MYFWENKNAQKQNNLQNMFGNPATDEVHDSKMFKHVLKNPNSFFQKMFWGLWFRISNFPQSF